MGTFYLRGNVRKLEGRSEGSKTEQRKIPNTTGLIEPITALDNWDLTSLGTLDEPCRMHLRIST